MKRIAYPAGVLLIGLAISHVLFTILVHLSNLSLYERALHLKAAGYLVNPGEPVLSNLPRIWPAFCGALFFTVTTGAGLTLLGFAAAWIHRRLSGRRMVTAGIVVIWLALVAATNMKGWNAQATSAFLLIPALVFLICHRWMPAVRGGNLARVVHITVILVVAAAWVPRLDGNVFINVRDFLLMENPAGKAVNTFYYRYTLYPAELFKPLGQKIQKSVCITGISDTDLSRKVADRLIDYEYLPLPSGTPCDLSIGLDGERLLFSNPDKPIVNAEVDAFLSSPGTILSQLSEKGDVNGVFRLFTFVSLVIAFPLSLYILAHALFGILFTAAVRPVAYRSVLASLVCMAIGIGAAVPLYAGASEPLDRAGIRRYLASEDWRRQRVALKAISDQKLDPFGFTELDPEWTNSPHVPVRYWLAQSLGNSRRPEAFRMLLQIVDDPNPNVACMAYHSLGRSGNPRAVDVILSRIPEIEHWYVQWYAYKSLKRLGWRQKLSDTAFAH